MTVASAVGYLYLLQEPNALIQSNALRSLSAMVNSNWHEIVDYLDLLVEMAESEEFPERQLAALITSKLYFHTGQLDKSVAFALMSGEHFHFGDSQDECNSEYVDIVLARAVDKYVAARQSFYPNTGRFTNEPQLERLEALVERLVGKCIGMGEYVQVAGIGLECRRLDILENTLNSQKLDHDQRLGLIYYIVDITVKYQTTFRHELLRFCVTCLQSCESPDHVTIADCLIMLEDCAGLTKLLEDLLASSRMAEALQICFNINDNVNPTMKATIMDRLKGAQLVHDALSGDTANQLRLHFLSKEVASDLLILERTRTSFNQGNSMFHSAVSLSNALMHAGTTNDEFLRKNMEWLSAASNWSKYTAVSAFGSIYRGHRQQSRHLLSQYLPKSGVVSSEYSEAGALFALGLIHSGFPSDGWVGDYLLDILQNTKGISEVVQHGCCYGIGAAGLGSGREDAVEALRAVLFSDSAVAGEAAALALGLVKLGSADMDLVSELLGYARDTKHDKIIRGLCVAVGLILYGHPEQAMSLVNSQLIIDHGGWMRFCGCWVLALSHAGTGSRDALQTLLRLAVTDSNQDVRRVAVIAMSFVLLGRSSELPDMVRLLLESYNPNLRFGALLALGIGFAGTGNVAVLDMIDGLMRGDKTDYVRQAAMLSAAMVLMQQSEATQLPLRQHLERVVSTKHEEALAKYGAVLAQGILDAGGRNQSISLTCPNGGGSDPVSVAGMAMFCQYWFWYPNINFLSLAMRPTALIGVTVSALPPKTLSVVCNARPSLFAYPTPLKGDKEIAQVTLVTAVLSTQKQSSESNMLVDHEERKTEDTAHVATDSVESGAKEAETMEEDSFALSNFARVTAEQAKHLHFSGSRYRPVSRFHPRCVTVLLDALPDEPAEYVELVDPVEATEAGASAEEKTSSA